MRWVALGVAAACGLAGPAGAAIMEATISGNWNGDYDYRSWSLDVVYDTSLATEGAWTDQFGAVGHQLTAPSVVSETLTLNGWKTWQGWLGDFDTFTPIPDVSLPLGASLEILQSDNVFLVQGYGLSGLRGPPGGINLNLGIIPFDQSGSYSFCCGADETSAAPSPGVSGTQKFAENITLKVLSAGIPEPSTWAMMLVGFFGAGAAVRRRRRRVQPVYRPA